MSAETSRIVVPERRESADQSSGMSLRTASLVAGTGLLAMVLLAAFGNFVVVQGLVTPGDPAQTARDILGSEGLFRLGIVSLYLVVALDLVVAWALYRLFAPVKRAVSMLAAWFRISYAAVFLVAGSSLVAALGPLTDSWFAGFTEPQRHTLALSRIEAFEATWSAGLVLFGMHLFLVGYLALRSGWMPRYVGFLVVIAGAGYLVDSVTAVLLSDATVKLASFTFVGEVVLMFWLLIRGRYVASRPDLAPNPTSGTFGQAAGGSDAEAR